MIFYFTGTGNSLAAAKIIAQATDDKLIDIGHAYKYKEFNFILKQGENLGFVFPTYEWSTPPIIDGFIKHARFQDADGNSFKPGYCYLVLTCGSFVGNAARFFAKELYEDQSYTLDASFSIKSVGNCVSLYSPAEGEKKDRLLLHAKQEALGIAREVVHQEKIHKEAKNPFGIIMSTVTNRSQKPRSTREFYTLPTCTSCGQCAEICPTNTITIIDRKPRWAELGCTKCFACIHRCPAHAIQYGKATETRGRYINPVLLDQE